MLFHSLNSRTALALRAFGLGLVLWATFSSQPAPAGSGRGLVIAVLLGAGVIGWVIWTWQSYSGKRVTAADLFILVAAGGLLTAASPEAPGSTFAFVGVATAGFRLEIREAQAVTGLALFGLALGVLLYDQAAVEVLAYGLGFVASALAGANARQSLARAEQAELLLAQVQRSREEQLRVARLEESARIAREIHDVLAHTLAGLTIQLEATSSIVENGAERPVVLERLRRAHSLAREGLEETRRAVGVLRSEGLAVGETLEALVAEYGASSPGASASLKLDGAARLLEGPAALAVVRVAQEALTNVRKHAPGATVQVGLEVEADQAGGLVLRVRDGGPREAPEEGAEALTASGGGYGLPGMRERAQILGGSLLAGPEGRGWRVELRLPPAAVERSGEGLPAGRT
jgi:signal transduction histidine kinase